MKTTRSVKIDLKTKEIILEETCETPKPPVESSCRYCRNKNYHHIDELIQRNTEPPSWLIKCNVCGMNYVAFPPIMITRFFAQMTPEQALYRVCMRLKDMGL